MNRLGHANAAAALIHQHAAATRAESSRSISAEEVLALQREIDEAEAG